MSIESKIQKALKLLNDRQRKLVLKVTESLGEGVEQWVGKSSDIVTTKFAESFSDRLLVHHGANDENLKKKAFEFAFREASAADGRDATIVSSQTNPGADVVVDEVNFSLKTEGSKTINPEKLTISKFMEGRFIRDCKTPAQFAKATRQQIGRHLDEYTRILCLRSFDLNDEIVKYELVEIPVSVLRLSEKLTSSDFSARTEVGSSTAKVVVDGDKLFSLSFDGSVEKVTIRSLQKSQCIVHATWKVCRR